MSYHSIREFFKSCCSHNSCEGFGHASTDNTLVPSHWIEVDIDRLLFSLAVKMPNFGDYGPETVKKVINSSTKCLISVKIAILTPHIIPPPLVNVWLILDLAFAEICQSIVHAFIEHTSFVWIYSQLHIHTTLYVWPPYACWHCCDRFPAPAHEQTAHHQIPPRLM